MLQGIQVDYHGVLATDSVPVGSMPTTIEGHTQYVER
jgi:hypothetical protein